MADNILSPNVEYRKIPGFSNYLAGADGTIWSCWKKIGWGDDKGFTHVPSDTWRLLTGTVITIGYKLYSMVNDDGEKVRTYGHRMVLLAFRGESPKNMVCCHNNGVRTDNRIENIRWDTPSNNQLDRFIHGTDSAGSKHSSSKLNCVQVKEIRRLLNEHCFTHKEIAKQFNVSCTTIHRIKYRKRYTRAI